MNKQLLFDENARRKIQEGINIVANAVKVTLGPKGRNVILDQEYGQPHITKDGVSVAKEIELKDRYQNVGVKLIKSVASKTVNDVGDATTTSTVLTQAIVKEGLKNVTAGANPMDLKKGIDQAVSKVVGYIKAISIPVDDKIAQVATISANNDEEIGNLIADAVKQADDTTVELTGKIEKSLGDEKYTFKDESGSVTVDIDNEDFRGVSINENDTVKLKGEVDKELLEAIFGEKVNGDEVTTIKQINPNITKEQIIEAFKAGLKGGGSK